MVPSAAAWKETSREYTSSQGGAADSSSQGASGAQPNGQSSQSTASGGDSEDDEVQWKPKWEKVDSLTWIAMVLVVMFPCLYCSALTLHSVGEQDVVKASHFFCDFVSNRSGSFWFLLSYYLFVAVLATRVLLQIGAGSILEERLAEIAYFLYIVGGMVFIAAHEVYVGMRYSWDKIAAWMPGHGLSDTMLDWEKKWKGTTRGINSSLDATINRMVPGGQQAASAGTPGSSKGAASGTRQTKSMVCC